MALPSVCLSLETFLAQFSAIKKNIENYYTLARGWGAGKLFSVPISTIMSHNCSKQLCFVFFLFPAPLLSNIYDLRLRQRYMCINHFYDIVGYVKR